MTQIQRPENWMRRALHLARKGAGMTSPNPMVGACVVKNNRLVSEGFHPYAGAFHAERIALLAAGKVARGADLYVNLEPCSTFGRTPPCTEIILQSGIKRVFVGTVDPNPLHAGRGIEVLRAAGIECIVGCLEAESRALNRVFFHWIQTRTPFVRLKMAMTLDGKIATHEGISQWITSEVARRRVQALRREADAILVGGETVRNDQPSLRVRIPANWSRQPRRLVATRTLSAEALRRLMPGDPVPEAVSFADAVTCRALLERLGRENVTSLLVEGGGVLADSLLRFGAVHAVEFHIAPKILGGNAARNVIGGLGFGTLPAALKLGPLTAFRLGDDIGLRADVIQSS